MRAFSLVLLGLLGCGETPSPDGSFLATLETDDGQVLSADFYAAAGTTGVLLLHMSPSGNNDRSNFPLAFIQALTAKGFKVLNTNRRGVGASEELQRAAYMGPDGKLDAKAGVGFLLERGAEKIAIVGASNGSTSALDFAVLASEDSALTAPTSMVFLSGGNYTENNNTVADNEETLGAIPILFRYSNLEGGWHSRVQMTASDQWVFEQNTIAAHGTKMLTDVPEVTPRVADFLSEQLQ